MIGIDIHIAKKWLENGLPVAIPTETVYGLAANALNTEAVLSIFKAKNRPAYDPLIVHISHIDQLENWVDEIPEKARLLANAFWPGPMTLLLKKKAVISDWVTSGLSNVGIRIPNHPITLQLLKELSFPLAAPSANPFGYISPTTAQHVEDQLGQVIPYILDGGPCNIGLESTIIGFEHDEVIIYRLGGLSLDDIQSVVGKISKVQLSSATPHAPGMLTSHYAPRKPLQLFDSIENQKIDQKTGIIYFQKKKNLCKYEWVLSPSGNLTEAAHYLFKVLHLADEAPITTIFCETIQEQGLGLAIMDRLKRAAAK